MGTPATRICPATASERYARIREALLSSPTVLCPERALLVTEFFRLHDDTAEPAIIRKARALRHVLRHKSVKIFDDELIAGNMGTARKSVLIQPELAGVFMCEELLWMGRRKTAPLSISWVDRIKLLSRVVPYWLFRNMTFRASRGRMLHVARFALEQFRATAYLVNEIGGIGHFLPNYERMVRQGIRGYLQDMGGKGGDLHKAARIACEGVTEYAMRLSMEASRMASREEDPARARELAQMARICAKVPMEPAETFHEACQSLWLTHMAVCLEGLNSAVSFGRIDQYLHPYYQKDLATGRITREEALDIALSFSAKTTEHLFLLSGRASEYHGGYLVAQAATVGGMDRDGNDAVNDLTYLFLDVMEQAGLRDPNYMARIHRNSPREYVERAVGVAMQGKAVPGLFSDEATIAALTAHGYSEEDARDYGVVGCVEPTLPGRSFCSTDAALVNLPLCLVLALNQGRRFGSRLRLGAKTPPIRDFMSMDDVLSAFRTQVEFMAHRLIRDIQVIEQGNRDFHPTPFSSMLVDGCIETGRDVTAGGARFNSSGVQGVGIADVADSLAALHEVVFSKREHSLSEVVSALKANFNGAETLRARLMSAPKFGNDHAMPDSYAALAARVFHDALAGRDNTRGGPYIPGFYSSTCHVGFGNRTETLPSGRMKGEPFASSLGCCNGSDRTGPTALLNSVAKVDSKLSPNGYALNMRFDVPVMKGEKALATMVALTEGFFSSGGMEVQLNILDPEVLADARDNPGRHPGIVVRVAGYCAYFDDLPRSVKDEIIERTRIALP
jgi:pyruvate formate-lyase/glycerol dehydratase family glycyl radical enzyme